MISLRVWRTWVEPWIDFKLDWNQFASMRDECGRNECGFNAHWMSSVDRPQLLCDLRRCRHDDLRRCRHIVVWLAICEIGLPLSYMYICMCFSTTVWSPRWVNCTCVSYMCDSCELSPDRNWLLLCMYYVTGSSCVVYKLLSCSLCSSVCGTLLSCSCTVSS